MLKCSLFLQVYLFSLLFFGMLIGLFNQHIGLSQSIALPKDSYLQDYFDDMNKYLHTGPPVYFVIKEGYNYTYRPNQQKVLSDCSVNCMFNVFIVVRSVLQLNVTITRWVCRYPMQQWCLIS